MATKIGLVDFEPPAGGCLLTDVQFSNRLRDFVANDTLEIEDIDTLKVGRQLRLPDGAKLIIGRNQEDNLKLEATNSKKYLKARIVDATGPLVLFAKNASEADKKMAADFIVSYGKTEVGKMYDVNFGEFIIQGERLASKDGMQKYLV
jgi:tRNA-specific 2-thiouridylase